MAIAADGDDVDAQPPVSYTHLLPYGDQVVGTIVAVDTFLGVVLGISTAQYKKKQGVTTESASTDAQ